MSNTPSNHPERLVPQAIPTQARPGPVAHLAQYNVVLLSDADHTYNYMTTLLREVFSVSAQRAAELAAAAHRHGRAICCTTHKEHAEFKREQVLAFGCDHLSERPIGPMRAVIEPCAA